MLGLFHFLCLAFLHGLFLVPFLPPSIDVKNSTVRKAISERTVLILITVIHLFLTFPIYVKSYQFFHLIVLIISYTMHHIYKFILRFGIYEIKIISEIRNYTILYLPLKIKIIKKHIILKYDFTQYSFKIHSDRYSKIFFKCVHCDGQKLLHSWL